MRSYIQMVGADGFDWDAGNIGKCQKHGMSLAEIEAVFADIVMVAMDEAHSLDEPRQLAVGRTPSGRQAFVVFTLRRDGPGLYVRPVSARYMHAKEIKRYDP